MSMSRREFLQVLAAAAASGLMLDSRSALAGSLPAHFYDAPPSGNVSFLHITDVHAQLLPIWFREPNINLGIGSMAGNPPHLVGEYFLKHYGIKPGSADAHAFTYLDFVQAAKVYGKVGGFAHLKTLVDQVRGQPPRRAAAGRRRYLAGFRHLAVEQCPGHGGCLHRTRRRRHDLALGMRLSAPTG